MGSVIRDFRYWSAAAALILALTATGYLYFKGKISFQSTVAQASSNSALPESQSTIERNVLVVVRSIETPQMIPIEHTWKDAAGVIALIIIPLCLVAMVRWAYKREAKIKVPHWDRRKPRNFPLGSIGGKPAPRLDSSSLDHLADSLGYFQSERLSHQLDLGASVRQSSQKGGLPTPVFRHHKQLRTIYILEDAFAQSLSWNPISQELAHGLEQRAINVVYARFYGTLAQFHASDGFLYFIEDLDSRRGDCLILIFSDGKSLSQNRDHFVLESLSRWPMLAWMELREKQSWDDSALLIARYGIPLFPASRSGLIEAMGSFVSERGVETTPHVEPSDWLGTPAFTENYLHDYIERLLGDALPWAQACSMIQPITAGLADAVRQSFQPRLPLERIERLFILPGSTSSAAGIRFSTSVLAALRSGFVTHWSESEQKAVLAFILNEIKKVEPYEKDSLAHLAWEWSFERVRLELEPDDALKRLAELEKTPLGNAIRSDLFNITSTVQKSNSGSIREPTRVQLNLGLGV